MNTLCKKVTLKGYIQVKDDDLPAVVGELSNHIKLTNKEVGCLAFSVDQRATEPNIFDVYEEFVSEDAFDIHQNRVKSSMWGSITKNVDRHYTVSRED